MNLFFEISQNVNFEHQYIAAYNLKPATKGERIPSQYLGIALRSDRIWREDHNGVTFLKHRSVGLTGAEVDKKEFFWVKLKSVTL